MSTPDGMILRDQIARREVTCPTCMGRWEHFRQYFTGDYENVRTAPCPDCIEGKVAA